MLDYGYYVASSQSGDVKNHQAERAAADDGYGVAGVGVRVFKTVKSAGQRLGESGVFKGYMFGNDQRVLGNNARGDADEFGISAVVEEEIFTEIFLGALAEVAVTAGSGVDWDDTIADREILDTRTDFGDFAGDFVAQSQRP